MSLAKARPQLNVNEQSFSTWTLQSLLCSVFEMNDTLEASSTWAAASLNRPREIICEIATSDWWSQSNRCFMIINYLDLIILQGPIAWQCHKRKIQAVRSFESNLPNVKVEGAWNTFADHCIHSISWVGSQKRHHTMNVKWRHLWAFIPKGIEH